MTYTSVLTHNSIHCRHQGLPKVVCSISPKQTTRDQMRFPKVFRYDTHACIKRITLFSNYDVYLLSCWKHNSETSTIGRICWCQLAYQCIIWFRMIKVISDRVLLAYKLSENNHPCPDNLVELSSYSQEQFAIADSSRVNMDDIRDHHVTMSARRALSGMLNS